MKHIKLLLIPLTILLLTSLQTKAKQSDTPKVSISTVYNDVKQRVDVNSPKMEQAINVIAKDLKITADRVWDILVKQQLVWSWCILAGELFTLLSWLHFWYRLKLQREDLDKYGDTKDSRVAGSVVTGILAGASTIVAAIFFSTMVTGFINPEYGAIRDIANVATSLR